jgi:hypothetical protein
MQPCLLWPLCAQFRLLILLCNLPQYICLYIMIPCHSISIRRVKKLYFHKQMPPEVCGSCQSSTLYWLLLRGDWTHTIAIIYVSNYIYDFSLTIAQLFSLWWPLQNADHMVGHMLTNPTIAQRNQTLYGNVASVSRNHPYNTLLNIWKSQKFGVFSYQHISVHIYRCIRESIYQQWPIWSNFMWYFYQQSVIQFESDNWTIQLLWPAKLILPHNSVYFLIDYS